MKLQNGLQQAMWGLLPALALFGCYQGDSSDPRFPGVPGGPDSGADGATSSGGTEEGGSSESSADPTEEPPPAETSDNPDDPNGPVDDCQLGFNVLPNGRGGVNYEAVCYASASGFDKNASKAVFEQTVYPVLRANCASCHSTENETASGAQAPIHADPDLDLAHAYALTRVDFLHPEDSRLVVRLGIDRHNCFGTNCADANTQMLAAVRAWADGVKDMIPAAPRPVAETETVSEAQVIEWIQADRATLSPDEAQYMQYTSLHELHNDGVSGEHLNVARAAISKALNSTARWAPEIVNPVDINDKGIVYRFDTRDYWGFNKGVERPMFGGSDDDLAFGSGKQDAYGNPVSASVQNQKYNFADSVSVDPAFSLVIWDRVTRGNVEGAVNQGTIPPYIDGFKTDYIEASQLVYTLTRPDVYNAIMLNPFYAPEMEDELGVVRDDGMNSYDYVVEYQAITVDARMSWRAELAVSDERPDGGFYWKTWDIFTGQLAMGNGVDIHDAYAAGEIRFPFWAHPIPVFVRGTDVTTTPESLSFVATLAQPYGEAPAGCDPQTNFAGGQFLNCRHFTGTGGLQQSASEIIYNLPNGLQGYFLTGGFNQRRVDAFVNIVRDYRILRDNSDFQLTSQTDFATTDRRLNEGSSCIGCHEHGMNRANNDLRDWLDVGDPRLPKGEYGVDSWINDEEVKTQVRELYPPTAEIRETLENDRRRFFEAMVPIREGMILGENKNLYVEPIIWTVEYAQGKYRYPQTRSN